jgi:hypothetical protein
MHGASKHLVQGLDDNINNSSTGLVKKQKQNKKFNNVLSVALSHGQREAGKEFQSHIVLNGSSVPSVDTALMF